MADISLTNQSIEIADFEIIDFDWDIVLFCTQNSMAGCPKNHELYGLSDIFVG